MKSLILGAMVTLASLALVCVSMQQAKADVMVAGITFDDLAFADILISFNADIPKDVRGVGNPTLEQAVTRSAVNTTSKFHS